MAADENARQAIAGDASSGDAKATAVSTAAVITEITRVLREELQLPRAPKPDDDLALDLQLDSVGLLTLVVELENAFRVALKEEDAAAVRTVADLAALVVARAGEALPGALK